MNYLYPADYVSVMIADRTIYGIVQGEYQLYVIFFRHSTRITRNLLCNKKVSSITIGIHLYCLAIRMRYSRLMNLYYIDMNDESINKYVSRKYLHLFVKSAAASSDFDVKMMLFEVFDKYCGTIIDHDTTGAFSKYLRNDVDIYKYSIYMRRARTFVEYIYKNNLYSSLPRWYIIHLGIEYFYHKYTAADLRQLDFMLKIMDIHSVELENILDSARVRNMVAGIISNNLPFLYRGYLGDRAYEECGRSARKVCNYFKHHAPKRYRHIYFELQYAICCAEHSM